jgi:DNA-binding transcriptional LysR family regulator
MKLTLDVLTILDAIDRCGTFAAAAEELHRVSSSLSYQVQKLESELGITLFDRSGHRARLTPTGTLLVEEGRRLLHTAAMLEARARRIETGWESELNIVLDAIVPYAQIMPLVKAFYAEHAYTRLRTGHEVLGGSWDALVTERADLAIGAQGDPPAGAGLSVQALGHLDMVFCVAPEHPLADVREPIPSETVLRHRSVAMADTSRRLPPRTLNIIDGQDHFTVPNLAVKLEAQLAGIGCGHLPECIARPHIDAGRLVVKTLQEVQPPQRFHLAWRSQDRGPALRWWIDRLDRPDFISSELLA